MYAVVKATLSSPPLPEIIEGKYESAITKHKIFTEKLVKCSIVLCHFSAVGRACSKSYLNVLEAIFIAKLMPELRLQK